MWKLIEKLFSAISDLLTLLWHFRKTSFAHLAKTELPATITQSRIRHQILENMERQFQHTASRLRMRIQKVFESIVLFQLSIRRFDICLYSGYGRPCHVPFCSRFVKRLFRFPNPSAEIKYGWNPLIVSGNGNVFWYYFAWILIAKLFWVITSCNF